MIEMAGVATDERAGPRLASCSLLVPAGEIVAVVGATGSGKSLILDVLLGHRLPARGVSQVLGLDCADHPVEIRRSVTHVPPAGQLDRSLTLRQQLMWWASLLQLSATPQTIRRTLREVEIPDRYFDADGSAVPPECRVQLWLALGTLRAHRAFLIDDPIQFVSMAAARRLTRILQAIAATGAGVLVVTRDAAFADATAHEVVILEHGTTQPSRPSATPTRSARRVLTPS